MGVCLADGIITREPAPELRAAAFAGAAEIRADSDPDPGAGLPRT
ncbi:hypothetical protein ACIRL2_28105 [Embleya sp. NPDC127516]